MSESEWVITKIGGRKVNKRMPALTSKPARSGPGAVKKRRRTKQLQADLAAERSARLRERIERASRGEVGVRAARDERGERTAVERLSKVKPSSFVEPEAAMICDPPLGRRGSEQLAKAGEEPRVAYAEDVVRQRRIVNGRRQTDDFGGDVLARDVERL
jgi:hypothetical protein